ncbi:tRNA/rRNA methyltransferase/tRNA (cytidine32/uridine32-2'-O)-methyltransferase [Kushneria sinocarnis]|uniref:tRNA (cytidine/uridine-2'-O-)-methyltransferase TrmJ n=1 Tax=Kushneria sinocarnis TaxID=595502 RepID=A0A420X0A9_9GAMM|nr:RNA methyltransferase [Kushneria sinocarnis]RKR06899.1 tRNA/rRNA methyltransferase/tRNA (cytidine32/uridine32-2'-O)-methyltransferase [Kushneria sinocarnis]
MLDRIRIVLIGTSHPGNIGGAARAMKTMGLGDLAVVAPRCDPRDGEAHARSSGSEDILDRMRHDDTLEQAVADCTLVVGASARSRTLPWPLCSPRELSARLPGELRPAEARAALVFGREDVGLSNEELQRCHSHVHIPTSDSYGSLNLAAAVQVLAYECRQAWLTTAPASAPEPFGVEWDNPLASHDDTERLFTHLEHTLTGIGFHDPANPRQLMARLRRLLLRSRLDSMELNILRGILTRIDRATQKGDSEHSR